ncbi:hypothetical protein RCG23_14150 [Neobacillus sp. PS3-34]|nr:hypothetical protein [Neobacillus sp. PS3-34]WML46780.1 hypothetical protein RCG23_14150 [Neobacillus sp. PS3-34]
MVAAGIWKDVHLEKRTLAKIDHVFAKTVSISPDKAIVEVEIDIEKLNREMTFEVCASLMYGDESFWPG